MDELLLPSNYFLFEFTKSILTYEDAYIKCERLQNGMIKIEGKPIKIPFIYLNEELNGDSRRC